MAGKIVVDHAEVVEIRNEGNEQALIFIHGFTGKAEETWGLFPQLVMAEERLKGWDIYCLSYETKLICGPPGIWESIPPIKRLSQFLVTKTEVEPLSTYRGLTLVSHSMGGLVAQKAMTISPRLRERVTHAFCFGTPSRGLYKAKLWALFNPQVRDMVFNGRFIERLRADWERKVAPLPGFHFTAVAGDSDEFVPPASSLRAFHPDSCRVVNGNHSEMVKPDRADSDRFGVLRDRLLGEAEELSFLNAARVASELNDHRKVIANLEPHAAELDDRHMVTLALALEEVGQADRAMELLHAHYDQAENTDLFGVMGGRYKRRWRAGGRKEDIDAAISHYMRGYGEATQQDNADQILYHSINLAHLLKIGKENKKEARYYAEKALEACARAEERDYWAIATEAEAHIYLGKLDRARELYAEAMTADHQQRWLKSTFQQAVFSLPGKKDREKVLSVFGDAKDFV